MTVRSTDGQKICPDDNATWFSVVGSTLTAARRRGRMPTGVADEVWHRRAIRGAEAEEYPWAVPIASGVAPRPHTGRQPVSV
jgi:hypothetical protein